MRFTGLDDAVMQVEGGLPGCAHLAVKDAGVLVLPAHVLQGNQMLPVVLQSPICDEPATEAVGDAC